MQRKRSKLMEVGARTRTAGQWVMKALTAMLFIGMGIGTMSVAHAIGGGPWMSASNPLVAKGPDSSVIAQAYGTFNGYSEHSSKGSVLTNTSHHRRANATSFKGRGAYVSNQWWSNGNNCYVSSHDPSTGAISIACQQGWNRKAESKTVTTTSTNTWSSWNHIWSIDPTGSSGRVGIKVCVDVFLTQDPCSGLVYRGADY